MNQKSGSVDYLGSKDHPGIVGDMMSENGTAKRLIANELREILKSAYGLLGIYENFSGAEEVSLQGIIPVGYRQWVKLIEQKIEELES